MLTATMRVSQPKHTPENPTKLKGTDNDFIKGQRDNGRGEVTAKADGGCTRNALSAACGGEGTHRYAECKTAAEVIAVQDDWIATGGGEPVESGRNVGLPPSYSDEEYDREEEEEEEEEAGPVRNYGMPPSESEEEEEEEARPVRNYGMPPLESEEEEEEVAEDKVERRPFRSLSL